MPSPGRPLIAAGRLRKPAQRLAAATTVAPGSADVSRRSRQSPSDCRTAGARSKCSKRRIPEPSSTAAMSIASSSRSPAFSSCWMVSAPCTATAFSPAAALACWTALPRPSVTKWTVESGRGHPAGIRWVSTKAGPQAWLPPQPPALSKVRRPVRTAPTLNPAPRNPSAFVVVLGRPVAEPGQGINGRRVGVVTEGRAGRGSFPGLGPRVPGRRYADNAPVEEPGSRYRGSDPGPGRGTW